MSDAMTISEIAAMAACALDTLPENDQLEIFRKFFENLDDKKLKRKYLYKIIELVEPNKKWRRAEQWMETYMKKHPGETPKFVAERYMFVAQIDKAKKPAYLKLAQRIKNRLLKRKQRSESSGTLHLY